MPSLDESLAQLYTDCRLLSGGFERKPRFVEVVAHGWAAVPRLLSDLERDEDDVHPWVAVQLLHAIVGLERPKLRDPNDRGRHEAVRRMWLDWGRGRGLLSRGKM